MKTLILLLTLFVFTNSFLAQETKIELPTNNNTSSFTVTGTDTDRKMKFFADGGFYLTGEFENGTIPISGAGTRLMWYPGKRAFRVGYVNGTQWDHINIGNYSFATGRGTTASGDYSTAMGNETTASGDYSAAFGYNTIANGGYSAAFGKNTIAVANYSVAIGKNTQAQAEASFVMGFNNFPDANDVFQIGAGPTEDDRSNIFNVDWNGNVRATGDLIANNLWTLFNGGGTEYRLYPSAGAVYYGIGTFSDRRLKENIAAISSPLQKIQQLRGVTYNWNSTAKDIFIKELKENVRPDQNLPKAEQEKVMKDQIDKKLAELSHTEISFIAQEVEAVFPEWVNKDENGYKKINMKGLNSLLVEAIKELKAEKDKEIAELKEQLLVVSSQFLVVSDQYQVVSNENKGLKNTITEQNYKISLLENNFEEIKSLIASADKGNKTTELAKK